MNDEAAAHLERSRGALRSARTLLQADEVKDSISRAYYATFHAAKAALVLVDEYPKTHEGTHNRFWVHFVETDRFPKQMGQFFSRAQNMRKDADYEVFSVYDAMAAQDLLDDAEAFCDAAETLIDDLSE
jgi:uncharacterized protein (UPF0332 family)